MRDHSYKLVDAASGETVLTVMHLWPPEPIECAMCGATGDHTHAVPWYCGPVREGCSDSGYKSVCKTCHDRWAEWNDAPPQLELTP